MEFFGISINRKDKNKNNVSASEFDKTIDAELENIIDNYAATSLQDRDKAEYSNGITPDVHSDSLKDVTCIPINSNKLSRLRQYNVMSRFAEINWCIDEIAMDFFHQNENKKNIFLSIKDEKFLDTNKVKILNDEFDTFIKLFNFDENSYTVIKNYIIEGEACWENVIDPTAPEKGIRALKYIPTKYYDFIKDKKTGQIMGIYFDKDQVNYDILTGILSNSYAGSSNIFNAILTMPGYTYAMSMTDNKIPLYWPQITYFNSGMFNYENTIVYPLIENASAPYQQLSLLQDAAVILRITRAPERLVFNISTGGLPEKKAKTMVNAFISNFKSKRVSNSKGEVRNSYDPAAMLDAYFFWKQEGTEGSSVTALNSQAQYDQMNDIDYFLRRILKAFKIPYTRFKEEGVAVQRKETITYEEYSFTKYIIRQQLAFSSAIKKSFVTHLKLRKIWEEYNLNENILSVEFVKPSLYELYQAQQLFSLKMSIYKDAIEDESFSRGLAMRKFIGYTEDMVKANAEERRKEKLYDAVTTYFATQIEKAGPDSITSPIKIKKDKDTSSQESPNSSDDMMNNIEEPEKFTPPETSEAIPDESPEEPSEETPEPPAEEVNSSNDVLSPTPREEVLTGPVDYERSVLNNISSPEIIDINMSPDEEAGLDVLKKDEYPTSKESDKPKATVTFRDIFSKLRKQ